MASSDELLQSIIHRAAPAIRAVADFVYHHPELGLAEHAAAARQVELLRQLGFTVAAGCGGLPTAFQAEYGQGGPVVAVLSEYDALPELGHACGHNLILAAALATGIAVKEYLAAHPEVPGTVRVMGTPAEEGKGGKVVMLREHVFDDVDFVFASHPFPDTLSDQGTLAVSRFTVNFHGRAAHAATAPQEGCNALDAMVLLFNGINCWRQQLPEKARVHGIITAGGNVANIIPDFTSAYFYLRATDRDTQEKMEQRFGRMVRGAALMTDTREEVISQETPYLPMRVNKPLNDFFRSRAPQFGLLPAETNRYGMISSDVGNISQHIPTVNWFFKINDDGSPLHSEGFRKAAGSDFAFDQAMRMGTVMAAGILTLLTQPAFRRVVTDAFHCD
ncbi:MAG: amidohydrolase [Victivallales bacterium]|nr:amidohydrolase [Victivallales bacterium]